MSMACALPVQLVCRERWYSRSRHGERRPAALAIASGPDMRILVASSSAFRQRMYRDAVASLGHPVSVASGGVDCVAEIRQRWPELLILEAPLFWGGVEGVLQLIENER